MGAKKTEKAIAVRTKAVPGIKEVLGNLDQDSKVHASMAYMKKLQR